MNQNKENIQMGWQEFHELVENIRKREEYIEIRQAELNTIYEKLIEENMKLEKEKKRIIHEITILKGLLKECKTRHRQQKDDESTQTKRIDKQIKTQKKPHKKAKQIKSKTKQKKPTPKKHKIKKTKDTKADKKENKQTNETNKIQTNETNKIQTNETNKIQTNEVGLMSPRRVGIYYDSNGSVGVRKKQIKTTLHSILEAVDGRGRVRVNDLSDELGMDARTVLQWARLMEKKGMLSIHYPNGSDVVLERMSSAC